MYADFNAINVCGNPCQKRWHHTFFEKRFCPICFLIYINILQKVQRNIMKNFRDMLQKGEKSLFFTPISPFLAK